VAKGDNSAVTSARTSARSLASSTATRPHGSVPSLIAGRAPTRHGEQGGARRQGLARGLGDPVTGGDDDRPYIEQARTARLLYGIDLSVARLLAAPSVTSLAVALQNDKQRVPAAEVFDPATGCWVAVRPTKLNKLMCYANAERMLVRSTVTSTGLPKYAAAPAARHRLRNSASPLAVITMVGMCKPERDNCCCSSSPLIPGI